MKKHLKQGLLNSDVVRRFSIVLNKHFLPCTNWLFPAHTIHIESSSQPPTICQSYLSPSSYFSPALPHLFNIPSFHLANPLTKLPAQNITKKKNHETNLTFASHQFVHSFVPSHCSPICVLYPFLLFFICLVYLDCKLFTEGRVCYSVFVQCLLQTSITIMNIRNNQ